MRLHPAQGPACDMCEQVLHKFLEVFSAFDWDSHALSLQGPIPLSAYPDGQGASAVVMPGADILKPAQV